MQDRSTIWKNAMYYGAITGGALSGYSLLLYITGNLFSDFLGMLQYAIIIAGIVVGTKHFRDQTLHGSITYGKALGSGILISLYASIIFAFFSYILYIFIDPGLIEEYYIVMEEALLEQNRLSPDQIETMVDTMKEGMTPLNMALSAIPGLTIMGFVFSLITSVFLKKEENPFAGDAQEGENE